MIRKLFYLRLEVERSHWQEGMCHTDSFAVVRAGSLAGLLAALVKDSGRIPTSMSVSDLDDFIRNAQRTRSVKSFPNRLGWNCFENGSLEEQGDKGVSENRGPQGSFKWFLKGIYKGSIRGAHSTASNLALNAHP